MTAITWMRSDLDKAKLHCVEVKVRHNASISLSYEPFTVMIPDIEKATMSSLSPQSLLLHSTQLISLDPPPPPHYHHFQQTFTTYFPGRLSNLATLSSSVIEGLLGGDDDDDGDGPPGVVAFRAGA